MSRNPFAGVTLRLSIVIFLDILGFSSKVIEAHQSGQGDQLLYRLQSTLTKAREHIDSELFTPEELSEMQDKGLDAPPNLHHTHMFTDNVVLGIPMVDIQDRGEPEMADAMRIVPAYQLEMALGGFFVRGGMTVDAHYMDEEMVFGPGVDEAHRLEGIADSPRVILSESAKLFVIAQIAFYTDFFFAPQTYDVLVDGDGQWFVNYLEATREGYFDQTPSELLQAHARIVEDNLMQHKNNDRVWRKYVWVARYHNWFCHRHGITQECLVDEALLVGAIPYAPPRRISDLFLRFRVKRRNGEVVNVRQSKQRSLGRCRTVQRFWTWYRVFVR